MAIILLILIAIIIWLLIKIYDYKKINTKLSKQNNELAERIKLLIGTSQLHSENSDEKSRQGSEDNKYASIPPTPFNEKNADANSDGQILVDDAVGTVNRIMNNQ